MNEKMAYEKVETLAKAAKTSFEQGAYKVKRLQPVKERRIAPHLDSFGWDKQRQNIPISEGFVPFCVETWLKYCWACDNNKKVFERQIQDAVKEILIPANRPVTLKGVPLEEVQRYIRLNFKK